MKFARYFFALLLSVWSVTAGPALLTNGMWYFETNTNAVGGATSGKAGGGANNTNFAFIFRALTNGPALGWTNVYVALRTDGRDGTGTITDPRDGSTAAKFSAIWSNAVDGTLLECGPGIFDKYPDRFGTQGFRPRVRLKGAGSALTRIRTHSGYTTNETFGGGVVLLSVEGTGVSAYLNYPDIALEGVTLDANWHNLIDARTNWCHSALQLFGNNIKVRDVVIENTADRQGDNAETFPLYAAGTNQVYEQVIIRKHWSATNGFPTTNTGHTAFGISPGGSVTVIDSVVDLSDATRAAGAVGYSHGFGSGGQLKLERVTVIGRPDGKTQALYSDTLTANNVTVQNSTFDNVLNAVALQGVPSTNYHFNGNLVRLSTNADAAAISDDLGGVTWAGWRVGDNAFESRTTNQYGIRSLATWVDGALTGNRFTAGLSNRIAGASTNNSFVGNRNTDGSAAVNAVTGKSLLFNLLPFDVAFATNGGPGFSSVNCLNAESFFYTNNGNFNLQLTNFARLGDTNAVRSVSLRLTNSGSFTAITISNRVGNALFPISFPGFATGTTPPISATNISEFMVWGAGHSLSGRVVTNLGGPLR